MDKVDIVDRVDEGHDEESVGGDTMRIMSPETPSCPRDGVVAAGVARGWA